METKYEKGTNMKPDIKSDGGVCGVISLYGSTPSIFILTCCEWLTEMHKETVFAVYVHVHCLNAFSWLKGMSHSASPFPKIPTPFPKPLTPPTSTHITHPLTGQSLHSESFPPTMFSLYNVAVVEFKRIKVRILKEEVRRQVVEHLTGRSTEE